MSPRFRNTRNLLTVLTLGSLLATGLVVLDRYDVPSWLLQNVPMYVRQTRLDLWPVVISDPEFFQSVSGAPWMPESLRRHILNRDYSSAWEDYRKLRGAHFSSRLTPASPKLPELLNFLKDNYPSESGRILALAEKYSANRFAPFGIPPLILGKDFRWTDFPARNDDVIYIWEVNTLQHFPILAQAYLLTGNEKYVEAIFRQMDSWSSSNPIGNSVNWKAPMEVSMRLYSLIWTAEMLVHDERFTPMFQTFTKAIFAHARYVAERMDHPRRKNNHGIFIAFGLHWFSMNYPEFHQSAEWKSLSETRLLEELSLQYTDHGIHKEYATLYHKALLDGYLHFLAAKLKAGEEVAPQVFEKIRRQTGYLHEATGPDGKIALVGDSDDHMFVRLDGSEYSDTDPTFRLANLLIPDAHFTRAGGEADWGAIWALGLESYKELIRLESKERRNRANPRLHLRVYRDEGFFRVDSGGLALFGKLGKMGASSDMSGHSHSDISSFLVWNGPVPVVIDPGTYTYRQSLISEGVVWRDYLRSSRAHNVVTVDGKTFAEPAGDFGYRNWPDARLLFAGQMDDLYVVGGEHHAYDNLVGRSIRIFVGKGRSATVVDWFPGSKGRHTYETNLLLASPDYRMHDNTVATSDDATLCWTSNGRGEGRLLKGEKPPETGGWRSPAYGTLEKTAQFRGNVSIEGPAVLAFRVNLSPERDDCTAGKPMGRIRREGKSWILDIRTESREIVLVLNPEKDLDTGPKTGREYATDAFVALFAPQGKGKAMLYGGTYFHAQGRKREVQLLD